MLAEQHPDPAPADALEGPDPVEKEKQRAIAMKDVVVTEGIESSAVLEARRQSTERVGLLDDGHVSPARSSERVRRGDTGETATDDDRGGPPAARWLTIHGVKGSPNRAGKGKVEPHERLRTQ
jgi:hypothetical protein